jgi:hypothetical protein
MKHPATIPFKKRFPIYLFLIFVGFHFTDCNKARLSEVDWESLKNGIIVMDNALVEPEMTKLLEATKPKKDHEIHQEEWMQDLIGEINTSGIISCEMSCIACIETLPPQSEILVTADSTGVTVERIIDIMMLETGDIVYFNIHKKN